MLKKWNRTFCPHWHSRDLTSSLVRYIKKIIFSYLEWKISSSGAKEHFFRSQDMSSPSLQTLTIYWQGNKIRVILLTLSIRCKNNTDGTSLVKPWHNEFFLASRNTASVKYRLRLYIFSRLNIRKYRTYQVNLYWKWNFVDKTIA